MNVVVIPVTPFAQNCSLAWDPQTKIGAIVDPGGDVEKIYEQVSKYDVQIDKVILTHGHLDHVGGTQKAASHFSVPVIGPHIGDKFWLDALMQQCKMFGFPPHEPFLPDQWLRHKDVIELGSLTLDVLHCPGHTPGHVALVEKSSDTVIVGDILFSGGIGRTDFPQGNHQQLLDSIRQQLFSLPDTMTVYPGHGPTTTIGREKTSNPFLT